MVKPLIMDEFVLCDDVYKSGAVFSLSKEAQSSFDKFYSKKIGIWNISIKDKSKIMVVKTKRKINANNLYKSAYNIAQEFLDFLSVEIRHFNSNKKSTKLFIVVH